MARRRVSNRGILEMLFSTMEDWEAVTMGHFTHAELRQSVATKWLAVIKLVQEQPRLLRKKIANLEYFMLDMPGNEPVSKRVLPETTNRKVKYDMYSDFFELLVAGGNLFKSTFRRIGLDPASVDRIADLVEYIQSKPSYVNLKDGDERYYRLEPGVPGYSAESSTSSPVVTVTEKPPTIDPSRLVFKARAVLQLLEQQVSEVGYLIPADFRKKGIVPAVGQDILELLMFFQSFPTNTPPRSSHGYFKGNKVKEFLSLLEMASQHPPISRKYISNFPHYFHLKKIEELT